MITTDIVLAAALAGLVFNGALATHLINVITKYHRKIDALDAHHAALSEAFGDQVVEREADD